ncbi:HlyD family type I secretion periplasmic adaptor subunit [Roseovarius sp. CAU 1744]|uniref:HlyD family type I secretion periplasmic adaptor subunit n=1 Tax=Roseovarius sp. CAU 1744 TaxID=3140368 RepID=UPI00325C2FF1
MKWSVPPNTTGVIAHAEAREAQRGVATARIVILTIAGFIAGGVWLAITTTVPELVRAQGELLPTGHYQQVQAPEQGVVKAVLVEEGEAVEANQVLTILDSGVLEQELQDVVNERQSQTLRLENLRVIARVAGAARSIPPDEIATLAPVDLSYAIARLELFAEQHRIQQELRKHLEHTEATLTNARALMVRRIEERMGRIERAERLYADSLTPLRDLERQRDSLDQLRAGLIEIDIRLSQAAKELGAASAPIEQSRIALLERTRTEIFDLEQLVAQLALREAALRQRHASLEIRAPQSGVVHAVGFPNPGEVIATGTTLFELMPSGPQLVAQLKIAPVDIGHIQRGDTVALKFDTFDPRRYGQIQGRVTSISPNSVIDEQTGMGHFRATVALEQETIGNGVWRRDLQAGMGASGEIVTAEQTVLAYLMKPIKRSFDSAFGER